MRCDGESDLRQAVLRMEQDPFHDEVSDEERKQPSTHFAAVLRCLKRRLDEKGHVQLVLDNVTDSNLVAPQQTDLLTVLGPQLHLLSTTRLSPPRERAGWLTLGELLSAEAIDRLDKFRPITSDADRTAAAEIVRKLGGFALAIELVAAGLAAHPSATYAGVASGLGLDDLNTLAEDTNVELRRQNHERRLTAVLGPTLAGLSPAERRLMEYSALLAPDHVPLPWLKELVVADFPELHTAGKWVSPWEELVHRLMRLALLTPVEEDTTCPRIVRFHRLVQQLVQSELTAATRQTIDARIDQLITARAAAFQATTDWQEARWELDPFDALARH